MIYLDHHATTPMLPTVRRALAQALEHAHGNPSSVHAAGRAARNKLEASRERVARAIHTVAREVSFTSGGTEAVHLALVGIGEATSPSRVIVDPGAHPCVRAAAETLHARRGVERVWMPVRPGGEPVLDALAAMLDADTVVVASLVQHEIGAILPWEALRDVCVRHRARWIADAVQAFGKIPIDVRQLGASAVALSAHKIGGPTGCGALWLQPGERVTQQIRGGGQERGLRAGTENLLGAIGFGVAAESIGDRLSQMPAIARRRDAIEGCLRAIDGVEINAANRPRVATCVHASVRDGAGDELVASLDMEGICVSSSAACSSGKAEPSESLLRLYEGEIWRAKNALRVTLGPENSDAEVERVVELLPKVIARVRGG